MALQLPIPPVMQPPVPRFCSNCHRPCDPSEVVPTTEAVYVLCADCWDEHDPSDAAYRAWLQRRDRALAWRLTKQAKTDFYAALERRRNDEE